MDYIWYRTNQNHKSRYLQKYYNFLESQHASFSFLMEKQCVNLHK